MQKLKMLARAIAQFVLAPPPVNRKVIALFNAFNGQYACNPKYILLKLHEKAPSLKPYLVVSEKHSGADPLPDFVEPVRLNSLKRKVLFRRCNVYVTNSCFHEKESKSLFFKMYKSMVKKKKFSLDTWHGTPLKGLGFDMAGDKEFAASEVLSDFVIAGCKLTADAYSKCWTREPYPVSLTGTPRCDILVNGDADVAALKEKLGLPKNKKVFLFAPTYRSDFSRDCRETNNVYESGIRQMEALDVPRVLETLSVRFGGEWVFVYRVHNFVLAEMRERRMEVHGAIDGNIGDDMAEYLACADILMTDYSSSFFDYALTRRPCFLFALDREHYEKEERGFYLDYDALPFPFAASSEALIANIKAFDEEAFKAGVEKFLADIGNVEDGRAAERIADCILHYIETGEKRLETVNGVDTR